MSFEGSLQDTSVPTVLETLGAERQTGILTVQDEREIVAVTFLRGEIVGVDALVEQEESLGALMAEEGLVAPEDFASVLEAHRTGGGHVAELLVERGLVPRQSLLVVLRQHALLRGRRLIDWRGGTYKFYSGDEVAYEEGFQPIDVDELLSTESLPGKAGVEEALSLGLDTAAADEEIRATVSIPPRDERVLEIERALAISRELASAPAPATRAAPVTAQRAPATRSPAVAAPAPSTTASATGSSSGVRPRRVEAARILRRISATGGREDAMPLAIAAAIVVVGFLVAGSSFLLPLPWNRESRDAWAEVHRNSLLLRIDGAARAFHLVEGGYPSSLAVLEDEQLLRASDLKGPRSETLEYSPSTVSYALRFTVGERVLGAPWIETTAGDFLLDASFSQAGQTAGRPLVLLD